MSFVSGAAGFLLFLAMIAIIFAIYEYFFKAKDEVKENSPRIYNFMSSESQKRFEGVEISSEQGAEGREIINYQATDINLKDLNRKEIKEKLKPQQIITYPEKIVSLSKGELSQDKALKFILPDNANDLPESLKNTLFGRGLMWASEEANAQKTIIGMLEEGKIRREEIIQMIGDGELSRDWISSIEGRAKDAMKTLVMDRDKKDRAVVHGVGVN